MKLVLQPTERFFMADEVMVRLWGGTAHHTDGRHEPCAVLITSVVFVGQAATAAEGLRVIARPTAEEAEQWVEKVMLAAI